MAQAPAAQAKSTRRRSEGQSICSSAVKGVGIIGTTPFRRNSFAFAMPPPFL
jgi:hypothetical protein